MLCVLCTASSLPAAAAPQFQSPVSGARFVLPETDIIVRPGPRLDRASVEGRRVFHVSGSSSGVHEGTVLLAADERTVIFRPQSPFSLGETVTVQLAPGVRRADRAPVEPVQFEFFIQERAVPSSTVERLRSERLRILEGNASGNPSARSPEASSPSAAADLPPDFPVITAQVYGETAPGYLFVSNFRFFGETTPFLLILENSGQPIFHKRMETECLDFKVQPNGLLTYFDNHVDRRKFYAMNSIYTVVDSFACGNGYTTDLHELLVLDNGHALLMSYDYQTVDMSQIVAGGQSDATVIGLVIQELDEDKNVVFQWRSWDHFEITDATEDIDLTAGEVDYSHGNAIEVDTDGHLLISSRNMDEITKIDRFTGNIRWRLGGENNEFQFFGDSLGFSHQHSVRRTEAGTLILYDNGNLHDPPFSRAVEYVLDEEHRVAALVWEFRHTPAIYAFAMGSVQRLPNGNTLIGWGSADVTVTEVDPAGNVVFEMAFAPGEYSYRAFRLPWTIPVAVDDATGRRMRLAQNFPNPFRERSTIALNLPRAGNVSLTLHDVSGRQVLALMDGPRSAGPHQVTLDGTRLDPGMYFCRLATEEGVESIKVILLD